MTTQDRVHNLVARGGSLDTDSRVPFVCLDRQHTRLCGELTAVFERVLQASGFILGEEVERFEDEFARFCGAGQCIGVSSGTDALTITLEAAGIGPGDEVIVPAHTFIATALSVLHAGATPVLCDVEHGTGLIDPSAASAVVSSRTAAIIPVHLYGQVADMTKIRALAARHSLFVLEDAAQAHGARDGDARAGTLGHAAAFSFYPSKNLGALGDGGAICTADAALTERVRAIRHLGQRRKGIHELVGRNARLDGLQAALLRVKLPHLDGWNDLRRAHAAKYRGALPASVELLEEHHARPCVYHLFPVRTPDRDATAAALGAEGIATGIHYSPAVHEHPALEARVSVPNGVPEALSWAREELSLPMFAELEPPEIERVVAACRNGIDKA